MIKEEFIKKARKIHGNKYDYSKVEYINNKTKVCISCPEHGEFWQTPDNHLRGCGCKLCGYKNSKEKQRKAKEFFLSEILVKYGKKYDTSEVCYVNDRTKVCLICHEKDEFGEEHGRFLVTPNNFLRGRECPKCKKKFKLTKEYFEKKSVIIHGNKYDYSESKINGVDKKIKIICPEHGEFWQTPYKHLLGQGCPKCGNIEKGLKRRKNFSELKKQFNEVHDNKYDYSESEYFGTDVKIKIICPEHGEFWQTPYSHLSGCGCPKCNESKLEKEIRKTLNDNSIKFEYRERNLKWLEGLELDFYLPDYNIAIECQGWQHFKPVDFAGKGEEWSRQEFAEISRRDAKKLKLCNENNVKLLYYSNLGIKYPYYVFENKIELLKEIKNGRILQN